MYIGGKFLIAEAVGAKVDWKESTRSVEVNYFTDMNGTVKIGGSTTLQPISQASADHLMKLNSGNRQRWYCNRCT
ncbi:hypothetical protein [Serpentinicella alkaliphila]|uniref:Uncharacterized protein n=1 Tax=Serpentinicella alkaliphila TaxID=1734049 RepID=A0A4R2TN69_9FIRM|nr:hypothetical protein [Serpentinicella alkaliphila]QUH27092.1 hypothetical protein HZR23_16095 [Serpentinicella alkaliphila]TCQ05220.1 hypothetical protein EDD79_100535 [Serpentinicella alkaliphila]